MTEHQSILTVHSIFKAHKLNSLITHVPWQGMFHTCAITLIYTPPTLPLQQTMRDVTQKVDVNGERWWPRLPVARSIEYLMLLIVSCRNQVSYFRPRFRFLIASIRVIWIFGALLCVGNAVLSTSFRNDLNAFVCNGFIVELFRWKWKCKSENVCFI